MMSTALFGISLVSLFSAIAQVESGNGKTSDNVYQISSTYVRDVNKICTRFGRREHFMWIDRFSRVRSKCMMVTYWQHYGERYRRITGKEPTAEVLARIHNGGPDGWRKPSTLIFWKKVKAAMDAAKGAEQ